MAWKPTLKPTLTWSDPTSKRPPASTSAGGPAGAAPAGPLAHPPARPRRCFRGIIPLPLEASSQAHRLGRAALRIVPSASPGMRRLAISCWVCFPALSLRTRRSGHAARATPSRKFLLTVPLPNLPAAIPAAAHRLLERRESDVAAIAAHRHPRRAPRRRGIKAVSVCLGLPAWGARVERLY